MSIASDIQKLAPGALVELFELDATAIGGTGIDRFHAGANGLGGDVVWQGNTYTRFPLEAEGFDLTSSGQSPRPRLRVANIGGVFAALAAELDGLVNAKVTRKRTFSRYLDAVNFPGGVNPEADPNAGFDDEVYYIDRKSENKIYVEFELSAACDLAGVQLPRRQVIANVCIWKYRGGECGYAGGAVALANDQPTTDIALDRCGKRVTSCKLRFGSNAELPYGGFPATGLTR